MVSMVGNILDGWYIPLNLHAYSYHNLQIREDQAEFDSDSTEVYVVEQPRQNPAEDMKKPVAISEAKSVSIKLKNPGFH